MDKELNNKKDLIKPISLVRMEFIDNLVNLINSSQLQAFIIESILKDTYKDMSLIAQKQYEKDKADYYKKMQENG